MTEVRAEFSDVQNFAFRALEAHGIDLSTRAASLMARLCMNLSKKMIHDRTRQSTEDILHRCWDEQVGKCQHCCGSMEKVCAVLEDTNEQGLMIPGVPSNWMMPLCYFSNPHVWSHHTDASVCWRLSSYNHRHQVIRRFALMLQFRRAFRETFPSMYSALRFGNCEDTTTTLPDQPDGEREIIFIGTPNLCSPHHWHGPTVILDRRRRSFGARIGVCEDSHLPNGPSRWTICARAGSPAGSRDPECPKNALGTWLPGTSHGGMGLRLLSVGANGGGYTSLVYQ